MLSDSSMSIIFYFTSSILFSAILIYKYKDSLRIYLYQLDFYAFYKNISVIQKQLFICIFVQFQYDYYQFGKISIGNLIKSLKQYFRMSIKKINGYKIMIDHVLGEGAYGTVYKGEQDTSKQQCAIKIVQKRKVCKDPYLKSALDSQIYIMSRLKSANIVGFYDVLMSSHNYYIIQQLCDGDLENYLKKAKNSNQKLDQVIAIKFLTQICNGFMTLVKEGIVHRDLKPANLLFKNGILKIGDFGFAKANAHKKVKNQSCVGTPLYMPIEVLKSIGYTSKCDIWSIGCIFYEILHDQTPWIAKSQYQLVQNILTKQLIIDESLSTNTKDFLNKSLNRLEQDRICWDDLFKHPIFNGYFDEFINENIQLQNKYKRVMSDVRFKVNSQNIDLQMLWDKLGFSQSQQIKFNEFQNFLQSIDLSLIKLQQRYFFQKLDPEGKGTINLSFFNKQLQKYSILVSRTKNKNSNQVKKFESINVQLCEVDQNIAKSQNGWNQKFQKRVKACFLKLHKLITQRNITLEKTFKIYDSQGNGQLSMEQFSKIMKKLDSTFNADQIQAVFNVIDSDASKSIKFQQLNVYYCKVNGIPAKSVKRQKEQENDFD